MNIFKMRTNLLVASAFCLINFWAKSQSFEQAQGNPFGLNFDNLVLEYHFASFADLDEDGDQDMLVSDFDGFFYYVENTGTATAPAFSTGVQNPFGISRVDYPDCSCNTMVHRFADMDNDGDMDIIAIAWYGAEYLYAENTGTSTSPQYKAFSDSVDWMPASFTYGAYPGIDIVDIDADGDLDLFSCQDDRLNLIRNEGTANEPSFSSGHQADPYGLELSGKNLFPTFVDIDEDGDYDLFVGGNSILKEDFQFYENTGTATNPVFEAVVENPFDLENSEIDFPSFSFVDIDNDTDMDLFVGGKLDDDMAFTFYRNTYRTTSVVELEASDVYLYPNPTSDYVYIESNSLDVIKSIKVFDMLGSLQYYSEINIGGTHTFDLSQFKPGYYFVEVLTGDNKQIIQLFKQ